MLMLAKKSISVLCACLALCITLSSFDFALATGPGCGTAAAGNIAKPIPTLKGIYESLFALGHEYRSFDKFQADQEHFADRIFSVKFPDWKSRKSFSIEDLDFMHSGAQENGRFYPYQVLTILPTLVSRYHIDAPHLVAHILSTQPTILKDMGRSDHLRMISLWSSGTIGQKNLEAIVRHADRVQFHLLVQFATDKNVLKAIYKERLENDIHLWEAETTDSGDFYPLVSRTADPHLDVLANLPFNEIPPSVMERIGSYWLNLSRYEPIVSDKVVTSTFNARRYGQCSVRCSTFLGTLVLPFFRDRLNWHMDQIEASAYTSGDVGLVRVEGKILGAVKFQGDDEGFSFLALRNVFSQDGRLVMAMGGVYALQSTFLHTAYEAKRTHGPWVVIDTPRLLVEPQSFLYNGQAEQGGITAFLSAKENSPTNSSNTNQRRIWPRFLEALEEIRLRLEAGERPARSGTP